MVERTIRICLVRADGPQHHDCVEIDLPLGATIIQALQATGWLDLVDPVAGVGVWGHHAALDGVLRDLDRIELYRPLTADPKVARRERFEQQGARSAGLFAHRRQGAKAGY